MKLLNKAVRGDETHVRSLLNEGVKVNIKDGYGLTAPLYEAARFGGPNIIKLLISYGAAADAMIGPGGEIALHGAVERGKEYQVLFSNLEERDSSLSDDISGSSKSSLI